jgi:hypothetical protein
MATKKYLDYAGLVEYDKKIKEYIDDIGHVEFKGAVANVSSLPALADQKIGWMWTIKSEGITTSDFTDGAGKSVAANSEVVAVEMEGTIENTIWSVNGGSSYVDASLAPYTPSGTVGSATKLCDVYVADGTETHLVSGTAYVTTDGTDFFTVTQLAATFADFVKLPVSDSDAITELQGLYTGSSFVDLNTYTETEDVSGKKWCLLGPIFDVANKLSFGKEFPANPEDEDWFLYTGETSYDYVSATVNKDSNPAALGLFELDGTDYVATSDTEPATVYKAWGSADYFTKAAEPSVGDTVYTISGGAVTDSGFTVTAYTAADGIEVDGSNYARDEADDEYIAEKNYFEAEEKYVKGVIYEYLDSESDWIATSDENQYSPITIPEIDALFD